MGIHFKKSPPPVLSVAEKASLEAKKEAAVMARKVLPTPEQIEWAEQEVGVIIHYDIPVFEPSYQFRKQWGYHPDAKAFCPTALDTDQWLHAAKLAGARYAVLVAKHCTGFCLWPTEAHEYSVKNSGYDGDIVGEFIASCKKYDIKPGIYYSTACNAYLNVDVGGKVRSGDPAEQAAYNRIVEQQLTELWSNYGELFEIWFDGGLARREDGGPNLQALYDEKQPQAVRFQGSALGDKNNLRWIGNEKGVAPKESWATITLDSQLDGTTPDKKIGIGSPDGTRWAPAECDFPNRKKQWFWHKGEEKLLLSPKKLMQCYEKSVGRGCNMLIGMVIDDRGLVPTADERQLAFFGDMVRSRYNRVVTTDPCQGEVYSAIFSPPKRMDRVVLKEDLSKGQRVTSFVVDFLVKGDWVPVCKGKTVGHKRIVPFYPQTTEAIRLTFQSDGMPSLSEVSFYYSNSYSLKERISLLLKKF